MSGEPGKGPIIGPFLFVGPSTVDTNPVSKKKPAAPPKRKWWDSGWSWKVWAMIAVIVVPTFGFAVWVLAEAGGQTEIDGATLALASRNAAGPVTAITGTEHTVYHANEPLPDARAPREDGRLTLVWFTTPACASCQDQLFVHEAVVEFRGSIVFVEKETGRETADERLNVTSVPTFVFLDELGAELKRFGAVATEADFKAEIEALLATR